uniref:Uncharacterized protein n=1 Tax=Sphaerodactylus townsendi TaxID=933632 RepID=A0ACB8E5K4_9SAUR
MKLQAVVEQLQKQQQQQQQTTPLQMDSRERQQRQMREAQLHYGPQLTAQQAAFSAASGKPSGGAAHPPPARVPPVFGAARTFDQSSVNSEEEEDEEGDEDLEDRDLEEDAASRGKDVCSALKYFQASKAVPHNQRVASSSHPLPALGAQRGHQGKEEQGKEAATPLYSGSTSGRQTWRLDEQQLKQSCSKTRETLCGFHLSDEAPTARVGGHPPSSQVRHKDTLSVFDLLRTTGPENAASMQNRFEFSRDTSSR